MKSKKVCFSPPDITEEEANEVKEAILSGWITTGPRTKEFERKIEEFIFDNHPCGEKSERVDEGRSDLVKEGRSERVDEGRSDLVNEGKSERVDEGKSDLVNEGRRETANSLNCLNASSHRCVCLNSQTACGEMALRLLGIGEGNEVIVPAYTYTASASVVYHVGAKVVLVDSQKDSLEMDYEAVEAAITERTKAIIPVDIAGVPCDYERLFEIVERKKSLFRPANDIQKKLGRVAICADSAHSFGGYVVRNGKKVMCGELADFSAFSFHAVKNLTTAEGGALTWNLPFGEELVKEGISELVKEGISEEVNKGKSERVDEGKSERVDEGRSKTANSLNSLNANSLNCPIAGVPAKVGEKWNDYIYFMCQLFSLHGQSKDALAKTRLGAWEYDVMAPWYKCNMTDVTAAMGLCQLRRYPGLLKRRKEIIDKYDAAFADLNVSILKHCADDFLGSCHLYVVRLLGKTREETNEVICKMAERGVACNVHYKPLPMMTAYKNMGFDIKDFPNAYHLFENEITLPLYSKLSDEDVDYVIENFKEVVRG